MFFQLRPIHRFILSNRRQSWVGFLKDIRSFKAKMHRQLPTILLSQTTSNMLTTSTPSARKSDSSFLVVKPNYGSNYQYSINLSLPTSQGITSIRLPWAMAKEVISLFAKIMIKSQGLAIQMCTTSTQSVKSLLSRWWRARHKAARSSTLMKSTRIYVTKVWNSLFTSSNHRDLAHTWDNRI